MPSGRPHFFAAITLGIFLAGPVRVQAASVAVLQFHNDSAYPDLTWVGESISAKLQSEFSAANQIVIDRDTRAEGLRRLSLRSDAAFTKATLIKLGQTLGVDFLCYGSFDARIVDAPAGTEGDTAALKNSTIQIAAHFLDLRKMRDGKDLGEAGHLTDLSRMEEHLAWQSLLYLDPAHPLPMDQFLNYTKIIKLEAEESYARGLLSQSDDQQQKWFLQANILDNRLVGPSYELGRLALRQKDNRKAMNWFRRVPSADSRYADARFRMGLAAYRSGDFNGAANYFREVSTLLPLNEVFNNLGAAESQLGMPAALDDLKRALDGDSNDPTYLYNVGAALLRQGQFGPAAQYFRQVLDRQPDDNSARNLLNRAQRQEASQPGSKAVLPDRLKDSFDETAYRQLKAMLQGKTSNTP